MPVRLTQHDGDQADIPPPPLPDAECPAEGRRSAHHTERMQLDGIIVNSLPLQSALHPSPVACGCGVGDWRGVVETVESGEYAARAVCASHTAIQGCSIPF